MARAIASNALTIGIVILLAVAGILAWGRSEYAGQGPLEEAICLLVPSGASMTSVSKDLEARGAISSSAIFRIGADYEDKSEQLKAGSFVVPAGASMENIIEVVTASGRSTCGTDINLQIGVNVARVIVRELDPATQEQLELARVDLGAELPPLDMNLAVESTIAGGTVSLGSLMERPSTSYRVTLAEGVTSWQVVESLKAAEFLSGEISEIPAEGYLAPDSYETTRGGNRAAILERMEAKQETILAELWQTRQAGLPLESPEEALTLASIVEKETGVAAERPLVASVFVNRLNQGMRLQTDPTVIYGITEGKGVLGRGLRQSELRGATPYNTYVIQGLPPTPIANPGRQAIAATLNPDTSDYLFFVADGTGGHAFAATLREHNVNVARWREIEAGQANQ
ncbi:endolytic transglycosylase MltG [Aliiruegeria sabulilitoris]|uniref:endolytic transglycosylase MltG n=1 Tax=Aliiruegeria sabulilitoris TaxID=1510458 RepID=UPI00082E596C|nr:endolytic transglycosylase MltG [Aliiruegeria sabulilitoris]NDR56073.1 endolytic transglycosylase MltG [Pseudoruegeria sp. M32A2M]